MSEFFLTEQDKASIRKSLKDDGLPEDEIVKAIRACERARLNPLDGEIVLRPQSLNVQKDKQKEPIWVKKLVVIFPIETLRKKAEDTGEYKGQLGPYWWVKGAPGWTECVFDPQAVIVAAKVGVIREGFEHPVYGVAHFSEFKPGQGPGQYMPAHMLAKTAEANALQRAFPGLLVFEAEEAPGVSEVKEEPKTPEKAQRIENGGIPVAGSNTTTVGPALGWCPSENPGKQEESPKSLESEGGPVPAPLPPIPDNRPNFKPVGPIKTRALNAAMESCGLPPISESGKVYPHPYLKEIFEGLLKREVFPDPETFSDTEIEKLVNTFAKLAVSSKKPAWFESYTGFLRG